MINKAPYIDKIIIAGLLLVSMAPLYAQEKQTSADTALVPADAKISEINPVDSGQQQTMLTPVESPEQLINTLNALPAGETQNIQQAHQLKTILLQLLEMIDRAMTYWDNQRFTPYHYFLSKSPLCWFNGKWPQTEIEEFRNLLSRKQYEYYDHLGKIQQTLTRHNANNIKIIPTEEVAWLNSYYSRELEHITPALPPSHLQRYWLFYTLGALAAVGVGKYLYDHQHDISDWIEVITNGTQKLFNDHLKQPVEDLKSIFKPTQPPTTTATIIEKKKQNAELFKNYLLEQNKANLTPEQCAEIAKAASEGKNPKVVQEWAEHAIKLRMQSKNISMWNFRKELAAIIDTISNIITLGQIEGQKGLNDLQEVLAKLDQVLSAQRLNIILLGLVPAGLTGWIIYKLTGKTLSFFKAKEKNYKPLRTSLLKLQKMFNRHSNKTTEELKPADIGHFVYLHYKACSIAQRLLDKNTLARFLADCNELQNSQLTSAQKLEHTKIMMSSWQFLQLNPG